MGDSSSKPRWRGLRAATSQGALPGTPSRTGEEDVHEACSSGPSQNKCLEDSKASEDCKYAIVTLELEKCKPFVDNERRVIKSEPLEPSEPSCMPNESEE